MYHNHGRRIAFLEALFLLDSAVAHLPQEDGVCYLLIRQSPFRRHPIFQRLLRVDAMPVLEQQPRVQRRDSYRIDLTGRGGWDGMGGGGGGGRESVWRRVKWIGVDLKEIEQDRDSNRKLCTAVHLLSSR